MKNNKQSKKPLDTSWNSVAGWYDELLKDDDSYQSKVIAPNLLRVLDLKKGEHVYDLACGQGYFSSLFAQTGAQVIASDLSKRLIEQARRELPKEVSLHVAAAHKAPFLKDQSVDTVVVVLAIQNIENLSAVFTECARVLKKDGRMVFVLNHPAFRVPQGSDWYFKDGIQYRIVSKYLSESKVAIDMTPGEKNEKKKIKTVTFHRSLQYYMKALSKSGFAITRLEEWISHKQSQKGPRQSVEDTARKEIPMFMCAEVKRR
jgi:ubiquinone/menaquinone biosynthesis C-methylase UbiE